MNKIELLAPAGSFDALRAAVENGADAVYLGGNLFSARQYANNFATKELVQAVSYAHSRGVKIHVAVNTLIANEEVQGLIDYLYQLAQAQVDAVIVQDLAVAELVRAALPELELHASTQMAVHNSAGVRYLEEMGFTRVVLAREVSLQKIREIRAKTSIELETFVHGALCVAYSGQCLISSLIGGRSGNRGRCAQPCRMKYSLVDRQGQTLEVGDIGEHLLSPKDLKMIDHLPDLITAGINSLKVEGRMKRPEYVATVIRNYREMIDNYYADAERFMVSQQVHRELEQIFNRDFTTGYFYAHQYRDLISYQRPNNRGLFLGRVTQVAPSSMSIRLAEPLAVGDGYEVWVTKGGRWGAEVKKIKYQNKNVDVAYKGQEVEIQTGLKQAKVGDRVFKTNDFLLMQQARESYLSPKVERKTPLHIKLKVHKDEVIYLEAWDEDGYVIECVGEFIVEQARKHALNKEVLWQQFNRLGNTPFELASLECALDEPLMAPLSELNHLRRQAVEGLQAARQQKLAKNVPGMNDYYSSINTLLQKIPSQKSVLSKPLLSVLVGGAGAVKAAVDQGADQVYLNWEGLKNKESFCWKSLEESLQYCLNNKVRAILRLPTFISELMIDESRDFLNSIKTLGFDGFLIGNLGGLQLALEQGLDNLYADYPLNIFNDLTILSLTKGLIKQASLSPELTLEQIKDFNYLGNLPLEVMVHGNFPLMTSEYCVVGSVKGGRTMEQHCGHVCLDGDFGLKDRLGFVFPLAFDEHCRMLVFNAKPLNLYRDLQSILKVGLDSIRIEARHEGPQWVQIVTQAYRQALDDWGNHQGNFGLVDKSMKALEALEPNGSTTGHFFRGVI